MSHRLGDESSYEVIKFDFDVAKLQCHLHETLLKIPPTMQTPAFGGWSVLSSNGKIEDGWGQGHLALIPDINGVTKYNPDERKRHGLTDFISDYNVETPICTGYLAEVMAAIRERKMNPRRARVSMILPGFSTDLHVDGRADFYSVRLHIPILTNPECKFEYEESSFHMPANGDGYLVKVNRRHRAFNFGLDRRYHLIMDVYDFTGATLSHRFDASKEKLSGWRPATT